MKLPAMTKSLTKFNVCIFHYHFKLLTAISTSSSQNQVQLGEGAAGHFMHWNFEPLPFWAIAASRNNHLPTSHFYINDVPANLIMISSSITVFIEHGQWRMVSCVTTRLTKNEKITIIDSCVNAKCTIKIQIRRHEGGDRGHMEPSTPCQFLYEWQ